MQRQMYVNVKNEEESRIAILEDGILEEISVENSTASTIEGNIYKGKIDRVVSALDAVFVDFGREKNGFLAFSEIAPDYYQGGERKPENLLRGQEVMVQVKKGEIGDKGAALTTYISIPGRYLVLMPQISKRGVSKQILDNKTRDSLKKAIDETDIPEDMGYIVRTAAAEQDKEEIKRDVAFMMKVWKRVSELYESSKPPAMLYRESDIVIRTIRDYFTPDVAEILVDHPRVHERVSNFCKAVMPGMAGRVRLYEGKAPLFSKHNLESQIASIYEDKVKLPSGGSIVIQRTEALVSIDVNSGGGPGGVEDIEKTALITNLEAAVEAGRQLRLRDLGGLVVIDFIDMRSSSNRTKLKKEFLKAVKRDKARIDVGIISKFGLLELSRQRLKSVSGLRLANPCPLCGGTGKLRSTEAFALSVLRVIHAVLARAKDVKAVSVGVPLDTAAFLLNRKRRDIADLENRFSTPINFFAEPDLLPNQYYCEFALEDRVRVESNLPQGYDARRLHAEGTSQKAENQTRRTAEADTAELAASYLAAQEEGEEDKAPKPKEEPSEQVAEAPHPQGKTSRRKRRRKSQGQNAALDQVPKPSAEAEPAQPVKAEEPEASQIQPESEKKTAEEGEPQRKRPRRRRRRPKKHPESQTQQTTTTPTTEPRPDAPTARESESAPQKLSASAKRRLRRNRKKMREESGQQQPADVKPHQPASATAQPPTPSSEAPKAAPPQPLATEAPKTSPAKRARKPRAKKTEAPAVEKPAATPSGPLAEKPKRTTRPRTPRKPKAPENS